MEGLETTYVEFTTLRKNILHDLHQSECYQNVIGEGEKKEKKGTITELFIDPMSVAVYWQANGMYHLAYFMHMDNQWMWSGDVQAGSAEQVLERITTRTQ